MSKAKHTPAPWSIEPGVTKGAWIGHKNAWAALACGNTKEEAMANARLIAASPEMYAMLKFIYSSVDWSSEAWNNDDGQKHKNELESLIKKIEG